MAWHQLPFSLILCAVIGNAQADLWQDYLKPMAKWPVSAAPAEPDLAPLPPLMRLNKAKVALGRRLFFDVNLSRDKTVSCSSCHQEKFAFGDNQTLSPGAYGRVGDRNSPSLANMDLWHNFFWDSRSLSLEDQMLGPLKAPFEMDSSTGLAVSRVKENPDYKTLFKAAYGASEITWPHISNAMVVFQKSLRLKPTKFDLWLLAITTKDYQSARKIYTTEQLTGLHLYRTKAGCIRCHNGPLLSDQKTHVTDLHMMGRKYEDLGRSKITKDVNDLGAFRTPTLRYISKTGPWMHHGLFPSLKGILNFYSHGGAKPKPRPEQVNHPFPVLSDKLKPFSITKAERAALLAYLETL
jgi:cytochrome c peroxidase